MIIIRGAIVGLVAVGIFFLKYKETPLCRPWIILAVAGGVGYAAYWILKQLFAWFLWKWSHRKGLFPANLPLSNNPNSDQNSYYQKKIEITLPPKVSKPSKTRISIYKFQGRACLSQEWWETDTDEGASGIHYPTCNRHLLPGVHFKMAWNRER